MRPLPLLPLLAVAACAAPTTPTGRYAGALTPAAPSDQCRPGRASVQMHDGQALFVPEEATWSLPGTVKPDGTVTAERTAPGADKKPWPTRFAGTWTLGQVTGTYTTPRCTFAVQLARQ